MVSSAEVPRQFMTSWNTGAPQVQPTGPRQSAGKLRSACDHCRKARVRCAGSQPCHRCSKNDQRCHYSPSLRQGRLKAARHSSSAGSASQSPNSATAHTAETAANSNGSQPVGTAMLGDMPSDDSPSNIANFSPNDSGFPELPDLQDDFTDSSIVGLPRESAALLESFPNLLDIQAGGRSDINPGPVFDSGAAPSILSPLGLGSSLFHTSQSPKKCSCLRTQLLCLLDLSEHLNYDTLEMDTVLQTARRTTESISQHINCQVCDKTSFGFVLIIIALQRMNLMLCYVARHGPVYVDRTRVSLGAFQLSDDEDRNHKRILGLTAANRMNGVVTAVEKAARECYHRRQNRELSTGCGQTNLQYALQAIQALKHWVTKVVMFFGRDDWGLREFLEPD